MKIVVSTAKTLGVAGLVGWVAALRYFPLVEESLRRCCFASSCRCSGERAAPTSRNLVQQRAEGECVEGCWCRMALFHVKHLVRKPDQRV